MSLEGRFSTMPHDRCNIRCIHPEAVSQARQALPNFDETVYLAGLFKAMGDPTRLNILCALAENELCVCDISCLLKISESAVSHQLRKLRDLALVRRRREGQVLFYQLDDRHVGDLLKRAREHADHLPKLKDGEGT